MSAMKNIWMKRSNALLALVSVLGIVVVLNVFAGQWFLRADLSENHLNSLSPYSLEAMQALTKADGGGELVVRLYASPDLPDKVKEFSGDMDIRGIGQKMEDLLEEYRARSDGKMTVEAVREDVVKKAEEAGLEPFVGEKTELKESEKGGFEMKQFVFGLTLHYRGVIEVIPKPLMPGMWEYQITKAILRLQDRVDEQRRLAQLFKAADDTMEYLKGCNEQITAYAAQKEGEKEKVTGIEGLLQPIENMEQESEALHKNRDLVRGACEGVTSRYQELQGRWAGQYKRFDDFLHGNTFGDKMKGGLEGYAYAADKLLTALADNEVKVKEIAQWKDSLVNVKKDLDQFVVELKKSAGQKALGFVCGHEEFCPLPSEKLVFDPAKMETLKGQNQQLAGFLDFLARMEQQINQMLVSVEEQLFRRQDFLTLRVDAAKPVPENVAALVVYAPRKDLSDLELYNIDQFLMKGGTVIAFVPRYDVNLGLYTKESFMQAKGEQGQPDDYGIYPVKSNFRTMVESWGVTVDGALVLDAKNHGEVTLPHTVRKGGLEFRGRKEFPYPLFVYAADMDPESVVVRSMSGITLPYASPLTAVGSDKLKITSLVKSSADSVAFKAPEGGVSMEGQGAKTPALPLAPDRMLSQAASMPKDGPHTLVALAEGEFLSYFKGKAAPEGADEASKTGKKDGGKGRLLVVGTDLGLRMPQPEWVFAGINLDDFKPGPEMMMPRLNIENWQVRISQVSAALQKDGFPFLMNLLDWGVQRSALADIRAKQNPNRRIEAVEEGGTRTLVHLLWIGGLPLLFLAFGLGYRQLRRVRRQVLKARFSRKVSGGNNE
jgi:ABC-type uncharacterized transport system involved in gliding motility auxiliary subunit